MTPPVTPPVGGSPLDLLNLGRGSTDPAKVKQLQDTLMALGFLPDIKANAGYGNSFGPMTQTALKSFQASAQVSPTGVVDRATVVALAKATNTSLGFDTTSPFAAAFGLSKGANATGDRPGIKAVQDALIAGGYLSPAMKTQAGYGTNFGPLTDAALKSFQTENGLPQSGVVDPATLGALSSPRARPAYAAPDGSLRQDFDRGSVWVTAEHVLHAQAGVQQLFAPRKLGTAQSLEEARASFLTQWGPTAYNDPLAGSDVPFGYMDCVSPIMPARRGGYQRADAVKVPLRGPQGTTCGMPEAECAIGGVMIDQQTVRH